MATGPHYLESRGISMNKESSWAAQELITSTSLDNMARFQQKQLREKEQRLLQLYDQRQQRAYQVARKGSAGSVNSSHPQSFKQEPGMERQTVTRTTTVIRETSNNSHGGKVRQMFDERRQTSVKGIDRSHPLEPLDNKPNYRKRITNNATTPSHVTSNGSSTTNRQMVAVKRVIRADHNSNVKGGEPVDSSHNSYNVHYSQTVNEFGKDDNTSLPVDQNHRNSHDNELIREDTIERNRMLAKIHLMDYDKSMKHRVTNDLESERFPEDPLLEKVLHRVTNKVPVTKPIANKSSAAEARLERFKTTNARRNNVAAKTMATKKQSKSPNVSYRNSKISTPDQTTLHKNVDVNDKITPTRSFKKAPPSPSKCPENKTKETKSTVQVVSRPNKLQLEKHKEMKEVLTTKEVDATQDAILRDSSLLEQGNKSNNSTKDSTNIVKSSSETQSNESLGSANQMELVANSKEQSRSPSSFSVDSARERNQTSYPKKGVMASKAKLQSTRSPTPPQRGGYVVKNNVNVSNDDGTLTSCKICGRRFAQDRVTRHEQICTKTGQKKRKQFDSTIFRVKGTELEPFVIKKGYSKKTLATESKAKQPIAKSNWRKKHEEFINTIRSAKQVQAHLAAGGKLSDLPPPPVSDTSDYIQCPHCGRKFNQAAAERHIPKCKNMKHNKPNPRAPPRLKR